MIACATHVSNGNTALRLGVFDHKKGRKEKYKDESDSCFHISDENYPPQACMHACLHARGQAIWRCFLKMWMIKFLCRSKRGVEMQKLKQMRLQKHAHFQPGEAAD
jgi:hypothetical protein